MKKFYIYILLMILVCQTGTAYAVQRVVTSHIISDLWYENVFLIADKIDSMTTKNFTVQVGGGVDSVGGELLYNFPNWYNAKFGPKLFFEDINSDGLKDVIVALISGSGSGVSTKEIHVLNQVRDPNMRYEEVPVESINDAVKRLVKMERKGDEITVIIGKKKYVEDYLKFNFQYSDAPPSVGSNEDYKPENGVLYGYTTVFVSIPEAGIGSLKVKYGWDGKMYKADSVTFEKIEPFKPTSNFHKYNNGILTW
ncbi:hypothetical protein SAMN05518871_105276 [Psychrobacillus sp. OK028]|uniref:hypothetical protein n=1 Tax=Psychrobacillus sp. OK028 TaxID=1884359 RepID=UPI00088043B5|nr:hypothetical protein [Psychrobacillus sp. OK028]SDN49564.1 hypothetical protein SAMN05518871_105276 [Psychrobacillus sp. OK028]